MGSWTFLSATPTIRDRNDVYGHFFAVKFKLKYMPSKIGTFTEMPRLEWKETITMVERNAGTWWQFVGDQYARNPGSMTFLTWTGRYYNAFESVRGGSYGPDDTNCLYDSKGAQLPRETFPRLNTPKEKADAVRTYLKQHGGIMSVTVVDKPGINKPTDTKVCKDRALTFDCGLAGMGTRIKAYQFLAVDGDVPEAMWIRKCELTSHWPQLATAGLNKVPCPADVTVVKPFTGSAANGSYQ